MRCTIVGDLHGKTELLGIDAVEPIIQIGDFGFARELSLFKDYPQSKLMIIGGNHDEYPILQKLHCYLGDYGTIPGTEKTFFCRGAWSIDRAYRTEGISWWPEEQLGYQAGIDMLEAYKALKPEVMITHDCPDVIKYAMFTPYIVPTVTGKLLDECLKIHNPKIWIFGHWHKSKTYHWGDTSKFICLDEGEHLEIDLP